MLSKIILVGLALSIINIFLKKQLNEFVLPSEIIFLALSVAIIVDYLQNNFSQLSEIFGETNYGEEIFTSTVKAAGVCLITKFSSDISAENGNKLISDVIEFAGRVTLLIIAVPYIEAIINIAFAFIK